ncbi:hypothetical protein K8R66_03735, partial [bacterium]|nr:hypothetical protein [bacterium]
MLVSQSEQNEKDFISLAEAAKHSSYSQDYLSLRARQGKLLAFKFGRNWKTKIEWLKKYEKENLDFVTEEKIDVEKFNYEYELNIFDKLLKEINLFDLQKIK